jgi:hypothetical protein
MGALATTLRLGHAHTRSLAQFPLGRAPDKKDIDQIPLHSVEHGLESVLSYERDREPRRAYFARPARELDQGRSGVADHIPVR